MQKNLRKVSKAFTSISNQYKAWFLEQKLKKRLASFF